MLSSEDVPLVERIATFKVIADGDTELFGLRVKELGVVTAFEGFEVREERGGHLVEDL
jgi:hypothetical protein